MIDFHCHLDLYPDPVEMVREARSREMFVLSVTTTPAAFEGTSALASDAPRIRTALGLHPQLAHERKGELALFDELVSTTRYVGEVGLDGGPELKRYWRDQQFVFDRILNESFRYTAGEQPVRFSTPWSDIRARACRSSIGFPGPVANSRERSRWDAGSASAQPCLQGKRDARLRRRCPRKRC